MHELVAIREELTQLAERLADLGINLLERAVNADEPERVALSNQERRVAKARRAVEKAVNDLSAPENG